MNSVRAASPSGNSMVTLSLIARVPQILFPRAKSGVFPTAGARAFAGAIGEEPEGERCAEVVRRDRQVARVRTRRRTGSPEQPPTDAAFVVGHRPAEVVAEVQQRLGGLDPRARRHVS